MIAALYVDARGPYPKFDDVDAWDTERDARRFAGPGPIVAHPPCAAYGRLAHIANRAEGEAALGILAVAQVRRFGGVLEHPWRSALWAFMDLPRPGEFPDEHGGWCVQADQCEWGHPARKTTWLYLVGVPKSAIEKPPFPGRRPTHWASGGRQREGTRTKQGKPVPPGIKVCSSAQRNRTPIAFARYLVRLAASVRTEEHRKLAVIRMGMVRSEGDS